MASVTFGKPLKYENLGFDESWTENYDSNPYIKDVHQVLRDTLSEKHSELVIRFIEADTSLEEAQKVIAANNPVDEEMMLIFQCKQCNLLFDNAKRFVIHHKWHTYGRHIELKRMKAVTRKRRSRRKPPECENEDANSVHICDICRQSYNSKNSLKSHRARVHFANPRECHICKKLFQNNTYLKSHMTTHTEEKKYMCEECPKTFKFLHSLLRHQPSHKERTFSCEMCEKSFGSNLLLKIHKKTHEKLLKGTTFQCSYCSKGFYHAYSLQVHERSHRGEKPFKCSICSSTYGTNSSLQRHLKVSHSGVKPYECSVCKRSFISEIIRDRHTARLHQQVDDFQLPQKLSSTSMEGAAPKKLKKAINATQIKRKKIKKEPEQDTYTFIPQGMTLTAPSLQRPLFHLPQPSLQHHLQLLQKRLTSSTTPSAHQTLPPSDDVNNQ